MEAPYLEAPADLGALAAGAVAPVMPEARLSPRILPGVCQRLVGAEDVMRGEETQLLGLGTLWPGFSGVVCMPGTHSKWVRLAGRRVRALCNGDDRRAVRGLAHPFRPAAFPRRATAGSQSRRRVQRRACRRHRGAAKTAGGALQSPCGVPAVGPHARLVRRLSLGPAHRLGSRRASAIGSGRVRSPLSVTPGSAIFMPRAWACWRQGPDRRRGRSDPCGTESRKATGLAGPMSTDRIGISSPSCAASRRTETIAVCETLVAVGHHDDRGAAQLASADQLDPRCREGAAGQGIGRSRARFSARGGRRRRRRRAARLSSRPTATKPSSRGRWGAV